MSLPVAPPVKPMLAKLQPEVPRGDGWVYEPKWDGFRTVVFRDGDHIWLRSRNDRPMNRYFPEVEEALRAATPERCVIDGEIIRPTEAGLDFDGLQMRLHPAASRVQKLAHETPCSFVAFDVLALGGDNLCQTPLAERITALDRALKAGVPTDPTEPAVAPGPHVYLTPRTDDPEEAVRWFDDLERVGLDGIIAKKLALPYAPGERVMVKIKHRRTADCVVVGYRLHKDGKGIGSLLLGVYDEDATMHYIGHTSSFKAPERRELLERLKPMERPDDDFGWGRMPGGPSRWTAGKDLEWHAVDPVLVCEVSYDYLQGDRFRHAATFVAWRDDKEPSECTTSQLERPRG